MGLGSLWKNIRHAWNAFDDQTLEYRTTAYESGNYSSYRPDRVRTRLGNEKTIITSIYTRLAIDTAAVTMKHVKVNDAGLYVDDMKSQLNYCLTVSANVDQAARAFRQDVVQSMLERGVVAIVAVDTTENPEQVGSFDVKTLRVGDVVAWYPRHVRVSLYNDRNGRREEVVLEKDIVGIVENPMYSVMNETNSTLQRLIRKLSLLDAVDEQSSSGKLDLIIQLPYVIKSEERRKQAEQRRTDIEFQLKGSQYGIAYTDGTEKITQLNRPAENNLWKQITDLTDMLYGQLGLTPEIMNGTADEKAMINYYNRTIEPFLGAVAEAMHRAFLTKTGMTQGQKIMYFRDMFKLVPLSDFTEAADKLSRNEIATPNEIRGVMGWRPADDPKANQLINSNMPQPSAPPEPGSQQNLEGDRQNGS